MLRLSKACSWNAYMMRWNDLRSHRLLFFVILYNHMQHPLRKLLSLWVWPFHLHGGPKMNALCLIAHILICMISPPPLYHRRAATILRSVTRTSVCLLSFSASVRPSKWFNFKCRPQCSKARSDVCVSRCRFLLLEPVVKAESQRRVNYISALGLPTNGCGPPRVLWILRCGYAGSQ